MIKPQKPKINTARVFYFLDVVKLVLLFTLFLVFVNFNAKLSQEVRITKDLSTQIASSSTQRTAQLHELQNHIDCIVSLFTQPNRSNLVIQDIKSCTLSPK